MPESLSHAKGEESSHPTSNSLRNFPSFSKLNQTTDVNTFREHESLLTSSDDKFLYRNRDRTDQSKSDESFVHSTGDSFKLFSLHRTSTL